MRLLFTIFSCFQISAQPQIAIKTWYNKVNESVYVFYADRIVKEGFTNKDKDTIFLNPIPILFYLSKGN